MNSKNSLLLPPRTAGWLLTFFAPGNRTEALLGDLLEEFSTVATEHGNAVAQRWYWRQTLKTAVAFSNAAFLTAPLLMLAVLVGGLWAIGAGTSSSAHLIRSLLDARRLYESHPTAYLLLLSFPLKIGRAILCFVIGAVIALVARDREMPAVIALALAQFAMFLAGTIMLMWTGREWVHWFMVMLIWNSLSWLATVAGGVAVKACRGSDKNAPASG